MDTNNKEKTILNASVGEEARDKFPVGMRVLVVDDDSTCLMILENMLKDCQYEVTTCGRARDALSMLRKDKNSFDIVLIDLHMPDMDGLQLLEIVGAEMDLPVVMMSSNDRKEVVMRGIVCGACHFLVKPVRMDAIKFLWQHVIRKKRNDLKEIGQQPVEDSVVQLKQPDDAAKMFARNKETTKSSKRKNDDEGLGEASEETSTERKRRFVWTAELHQKFSMAVNQLGHDKAVPKKILELMQEMNVTEITRENVASHLQKYRLHLQQEAERVNSKKSVFEQCSSLDGCNPQASATSSEPPLECFTSPPPGGLERQYASFSLGMRHVDQRNLFDTKIPESSSYPITIAKLSNLSFPLSRTSSGGIERLNANSSLGLPLADLTNHFDAKMTESSFYRVNELSRPALPLQRTNSGESVFANIVSAGGLERLDGNSSLGSPLIDQTNTLHGKMPGSSSYPVNEHAMVALPLWRTNSGDSFFGKTVSSGGFGRPESSAYPPTELSTFAAPLPLSRTSSGESFGNKSVSSLGNTSSGEEYIYRNLGNIAQQPRNLSIDDSYVLRDDNTSDLLYESLLHFKNLYHGDILRGPFT